MRQLFPARSLLAIRLAMLLGARWWRFPLSPRLGYILVILLVLLAVSSPSFLFDSPGLLDTYIYMGYFIHYTEHLPLFDSYYKISRLPWILPGYSCYQLFGPLWGNYVLQLATLAFGMACLYITVRDALDRRVALIATVLLGMCTWYHGVGGWNYHMGITTGYYLLTVLCLGKAAQSQRSRRWYFWAGMALGLALHTHLYLVVFVPGLILHYLFTCLAERRRLSWWDIPMGLLGLVFGTAVLGVINRATGGDFLFFMPQINYTLWLAEKGNHWFTPLASWLPTAGWLILPAVALMACPLTWLLGRPWGRGPERNPAWIVLGFQLQLILGVLAGCYYQFVKNQTVLDHSYQAVCLLSPALLVLSGLFFAVRRGWSHWGEIRLAALALTCFALPLLVAYRWGPLPGWIAPAVLPALLALAALVCLAFARLTSLALVAALALLGLSNADFNHLLNLGTLARDTFKFSVAADRFTTALDPTLVDIKYWFDHEETMLTQLGPRPSYPVFDSYVSTRGWLGNLLGGCPMPAIEEIDPRHLDDFRRIGLLSMRSNKTSYQRRLEKRFRELGIPLWKEAERDFHEGQLDVSLTVYSFEKL